MVSVRIEIIYLKICKPKPSKFQKHLYGIGELKLYPARKAILPAFVHDLQRALMQRGELIEIGTTNELFTHPMPQKN